MLEERLIANPDPAMIAKALLDEVRRRGLNAMPWDDNAKGAAGLAPPSCVG
ncbi:MAG: hypothetical protein WDM85_00620 [Caulobacteraceae bacterium]